MRRFTYLFAAILLTWHGVASAQTCKQKCSVEPGACLEVADFETPETENTETPADPPSN